jgi:two-component system, LytTR family, response regulator
MDSAKISAVIIDDEQDSINLLQMYLRHFPNINVTGTETNAIKGLELVDETLPELVFLDIDMPGMNGLQVADKIHSDNFYSEIVFTTAHQYYAFDALNIEPLDFLTKPFCIEDLGVVLQKFEIKNEKKKLERKLDRFIHSQNSSHQIKLPANHGVLMVETKDIVVIKSNANKCILHLQDGTTEIINKNLNKLIEILNLPSLFKLNRSTYANLNYLNRIDKKTNKCFLSFNHSIHEEIISRNQIILFEKLDLYPNIQA